MRCSLTGRVDLHKKVTCLSIAKQSFESCSRVPFGALWYAGANAASNVVDYAKFFSRSHDAVIRVYDEAGNVVETHERKGDFKEP